MKILFKKILALSTTAFLFASYVPKGKSNNPLDEIAYQKEIKEWQQKRFTELKSTKSPLNLIGMLWLKEGNNTFGGGEGHDLIFPKNKIISQAGKYVLRNDSVFIEIEEKAGINIKGKPVTGKLLAFSADSALTFEKGTLRWFVTRSGGKLAVRLLDLESDYQKNFKGVEQFPVDAKWRVNAKFTPYQPGAKIPITTIFGSTNDRPSAGLLSFTVDGKEYKLEALDGKTLFIIFSDKTAENESSYSFRFLHTSKPDSDGNVIVDFNKATNPNCAFSPHAPCPLPPALNKLSIAITAGEKKYNSLVKN